MKSFGNRILSRLLVGLALGAVAAALSGCKTTEDDMSSNERPWNAPKNWESGLPSSMFEGR